MAKLGGGRPGSFNLLSKEAELSLSPKSRSKAALEAKRKLHSLVDSYFKTPENKRHETASDKLSSIYSKHRKSAGHLIPVSQLKVSSYDDERNSPGSGTPAANSANFSRISRSIIKKPSFAIN